MVTREQVILLVSEYVDAHDVPHQRHHAFHVPHPSIFLLTPFVHRLVQHHLHSADLHFPFHNDSVQSHPPSFEPPVDFFYHVVGFSVKSVPRVFANNFLFILLLELQLCMPAQPCVSPPKFLKYSVFLFTVNV